jgi:hypothetical protein
MHRLAGVAIAGRLALYAAMMVNLLVRETGAVAALVVVTRGHFAAVIRPFPHVATREQLAAERIAALKIHFAARISKDVVVKGRYAAPERVCHFSVN